MVVMRRRVATSADMTDEIQQIDLAGFEALGPGVTVLDFTANWCPPCRVLGRVLHGLVGEYAGRVRFTAVDVDGAPALAERLGVRSVPTLVLWRDGREVGRVVGSRQRGFVVGVLERALAGDVAISAP